MSQAMGPVREAWETAYREADCRSANRWVELTRRLLLVGGVLSAVAAMLYPADALVRVRAIDFGKQQRANARRLDDDLHRLSRVSGQPFDSSMNTVGRQSLDQFIAQETAGRSVSVQGRTWEEFYNAVSDTLKGESTSLATHLSNGTGGYSLYLNPDQRPLNELAGKIGDANRVLFVRVLSADKTLYLENLFQRPGDFVRYAPSALAYPWRCHAVWPFIAGLLGYAVLPWHRSSAIELQYSRARGMVVPDMLGTAMAAFFFALPILVLTENAASSRPLRLLDFTDGWASLTIILWAFVAGGVAILLTSLWYATSSIFLMEDRIRRITFFGQRDCLYAQMTAIKPATRSMPGWLRTLGMILGLFNWRLMAVMLTTSSQRAHGLAIHCADGTTLNIWISAMPGFERIFRALRRAGVPLDPDLSEIVDVDLATAEERPLQTTGGRGGRITARILLALAIGGALTLHYRPHPIGKVERRMAYSEEALAQRGQLMKQMEQVNQQMTKALDAANSAAPEERAAAIHAQERLMKRYEDLERQYDAIKPTQAE